MIEDTSILTAELSASAELPPAVDESEMERLCRRGRVGAARVRRHKGKYWEICFSHPGGMNHRRVRRYRKSATAAVRLARKMTQEIREHGRMTFALSVGQRWAAVESFRLLEKVGAGDPAQLLDVVREHLKRHPLAGNARTLDDVRKEVVARKAKLGRSDRHVAGLDYKLRCLVTAIGNKPITAITTADLQAEVEEHPDWKPTTVHSTTQAWKIALNFAVKRGYLVENPANKLELPQIVHGEPSIFRVEEVKRLMAATLFSDRDSMLPECRAWLAIGMFAGLRPSEIDRLEWQNVDLTTATIRVKAATAKDRDRRVVEMAPNLVAWLRPLARASGLVLRQPSAKLRAAARAVLGLKEWPADVMRHTYASYHFGAHQNEALTKQQMGHWGDDGRLLRHHYLVPVSKPVALKFWGTVPPVAFLQLHDEVQKAA
jgi:integrase/recombinase XerD